MILHHEFIKIAKDKKFASRIAIEDTATKKSYTYDRLLIASLIFSEKLKRIKSDKIGIMIPTSAGAIITYMATLFAGKVPVMINYSTGPRENSEYAQEKCYFETIISSKKVVQKLGFKPAAGTVFIEDFLKNISVLDKAKAAVISKLPLSLLLASLAKVSEEDIAVILFTSGSEKEPKAVPLSHKNISTNVKDLWKVVDITDEEVFLSALPYFHVFGLTANLWIPITHGCKIVTHPNPLEYKNICQSIRKFQVTFMVGTPSFYYGYLKKAHVGDFKSLRVVISGADKLQDHIRQGYLNKHNIELYEGYGATETSPVISLNHPSSNKKGSIGKPVPSLKVKILNIDTDEIVETGKEGKIYVKGPSVMKGYFGDLEETTLHFHNGWYDTGDIGKLDEDGFLYHLGRLKRFVKIGGEMVSLVKIESELEKLLDEDIICCVVDVPNIKKGADIVVALTTDKVKPRKIKKELKKVLPSIAIPKEFVVMENIPMMPSGKVNFKSVEKKCRALRKKKLKRKK